MAFGRKGSTSVKVPGAHASFVLGSRPAALRNPRLSSNAGISIKPQQGVTQYGKQFAANSGVPNVGGVGFGDTGKSGES